MRRQVQSDVASLARCFLAHSSIFAFVRKQRIVLGLLSEEQMLLAATSSFFIVHVLNCIRSSNTCRTRHARSAQDKLEGAAADEMRVIAGHVEELLTSLRDSAAATQDDPKSVRTLPVDIFSCSLLDPMLRS
jgi:hypothetical protein